MLHSYSVTYQYTEHVCLSVYVLRELFTKGYIVCGEEVNLSVKWG